MSFLTPDERRGALILLSILAAAIGWQLAGALLKSPRSFEPAPPAGVPALPASPDTLAVGREPPLDLNRAGAADLERLPGIGPVLAKRIVAYREQHGPFSRAEELLAVRGVGPRLLERLRPRIAVGR
jgi:competence protein ComEA